MRITNQYVKTKNRDTIENLLNPAWQWGTTRNDQK